MNKRSSWIPRLAGALALFSSVSLPAQQAHAGGFTLVDRGARGLSRGGAFVAGADDPSALWYNPAALDESKNQILSDATLTVMLVDYQRQYRDGSYSAEVTGKPMYLPIPTLAMSHKFGLRHFTFAAGIFAPNMVLNNWPRSVKENGINVPAPQRYSLISLQGSIYSNLAAGLAWHPTKSFSIGADAQVSIGRLKTEVALSGCGDGLTCNFPEDPQYDVYSTADVLPAWGVTGVFGVKYNAGNILRLGASVMLPYKLQGPASLSNRLPNNALFENASVSGDKADFSMQFPLIVRVGSEIRPFPAVRLEGAFVWEQWSSQKSIDITPQDVSIRNIRGIGDYDVGPIKLVRNMNDVWSLRGGYEIFIPPRFMPIDFLRKTKFAMRGGLAYEKSAFTNKTLTPFTLDSDKVLLTGGFALNLTKTLRFESAAGWYFMKNVTVTESTIPRPMAIRPQSTADNVTQGNGIYKMEAFYLGGGFTLYLDDTGPRT